METTLAVQTPLPQVPLAVVLFGDIPPMIQPVADVRAYLLTRKPVLNCHDEEPLRLALPSDVRAEATALCVACLHVRERVNKFSISVQAACKIVIAWFKDWHWKLGTFRGLYDKWIKTRDWLVLVNRARAGAAWIERQFGLSNEFLDFVAGRCGEFKRRDALPEAIRSIHRQWKFGVNHRGEAQAIAGYEKNWETRNREIVPDGWTIGNLRTQLKARSKFLKVQKALLHEGIAAARKFIPQVRSTREGLRFMEEVQFDDVKCDFRVFDTATGKPVDLWLLVAHDRATAMLLGFGMRPATVRDDGTQQHLKLQDMKQAFGWLLERYGLPPYQMTAKVENGAATFTDGTAAAIEEMLGGRVKVSFAQMIGGKSPSGYLERALGNSKGKASLESHNRQQHLIGAGLPGQTGPHYGVRPKDLAARERECETIWHAADEFPDGLRGRLVNEFGYPLLTLQQARHELSKIFNIRNTRTDHKLEGFEKILVNEGGRIVQRMEMPAERMMKLRHGLKFDSVSPEIICAMLEHTARNVTVNDAGEIEFSHEGKLFTFAHPARDSRLEPGRKAVGYFHPDEPRLLYLTTGHGAMLGTWLRRALVKNGDSAALNDAIEYANSALKTHKEFAAQLNRGETARLTEMRERNNQLLESNTFVDVGGADVATRSEISSALAHALTVTPKEIKRRVKADADEQMQQRRTAREALRNLSV
ncbi:MAG TPA: hypothetical protein VHY30_04525 [Verrucomicrobiae bacterium]|jgi:hypothetical protein|nr:hypothetical protein [Verrucomicrobiae bacterium]